MFNYIEIGANNVSIVWQGMLRAGIDAINGWESTIDSWCFTVYFIKFIVYYMLVGSCLMSLKVLSAFLIGEDYWVIVNLSSGVIK